MDRLGKYEGLQHVATGGMATVFRARDADTGREVALKALRPEDAINPALAVRFRREHAAAARLSHENVVRLYEFGEQDGTPYFAMEFIDGVDLHEYVRERGPLDPEEARRIVLQAAAALGHAHAHGVVHRDVKPSNFLLAGGTLKVIDFGLARDAADDGQFRVTRAGTTVGTIDYMSPEQARDSAAADGRSDLYSLGSTWFHLLTGRSPFPDGGLGRRLEQIMNDPPPDVRDLNPRVSDETWEVIQRLLAKAPDDRHQTADELIDDLVALDGRSVAARRPKRREESVPLTLVAAVVLLAVATLVVAMQPRGQTDEPPPERVESGVK